MWGITGHVVDDKNDLIINDDQAPETRRKGLRTFQGMQPL